MTLGSSIFFSMSRSAGYRDAQEPRGAWAS
jgi:hypothetical protein